MTASTIATVMKVQGSKREISNSIPWRYRVSHGATSRPPARPSTVSTAPCRTMSVTTCPYPRQEPCGCRSPACDDRPHLPARRRGQSRRAAGRAVRTRSQTRYGALTLELPGEPFRHPLHIEGHARLRPPQRIAYDRNHRLRAARQPDLERAGREPELRRRRLVDEKKHHRHRRLPEPTRPRVTNDADDDRIGLVEPETLADRFPPAEPTIGQRFGDRRRPSRQMRQPERTRVRVRAVCQSSRNSRGLPSSSSRISASVSH